MAQHFKYIFLGGGNSAGYAAWEYVKQGGPADSLAIITDEPYVAYERPALSKAYIFPENPARLPGFHACVGGGGQRQEPAWYKENGIEYITNTQITAVDVANKKLTAASGNSFTYDTLFIGTGARPTDLAKDFKTPGADLSGIHYLRNVADADSLLAALDEQKKRAAAAGVKAKVTCIGGGYIGMETAAAISQHPDVEVTMVFPESRLFERLFTPELAAFYESFYASKGVSMLKGALAVGFEAGADGGVGRVVLKEGSPIETNLVIVGVGARPNTDLFVGQLDTVQGPPGGIKVDGKMKTSDSSVYAVGDVAAFPLLVAGGAVTRQEHVTHCRLSAAHAIADALAPGSVGDYDYQPFFYSRVYSLSWQFYGLSDGDVVHFGEPSSGKFGAYWVQGGKVVGAFLESGSAEENAAIKKLAQLQPAAPAAEELTAQGLEFAAKLSDKASSPLTTSPDSAKPVQKKGLLCGCFGA